MLLLAAEDFWRWRPHPEVWLLVVGLVGLYVYALRELGPRVVRNGEPVATRAQKRWFFFGILILWIAADWPLHDIGEDYLYSVHMIQHMLLAFVVPPMMLLATPEWLARIVIGDGRVGRAFLKLARPIPAAIVFNVVQLGIHWSVIVHLSIVSAPFHYGLHTLVVGTALAVWMPVVSPLPEYRIRPPAQCIHLFLTSIVPTVPASWLALAQGVLYSDYNKPDRLWGISVTSDQQAAGLFMKLGGGVFLWVIIVIIFFRWSATQDQGTSARRVVLDDEGHIVSVEDAETLTYDQVSRAFQTSGPPPREAAP